MRRMLATMEMQVTIQAAVLNSQKGISCHHHSNTIGANVVPKGTIDVKPVKIDNATKANTPLKKLSS